MAKISIEATQGVYLTYKNYTYTAPQVFGEYIDNAIQSNEEHKGLLKSMTPGHQLRVDISVEWCQEDQTVRAKSITIQDNAAGMSGSIFSKAFNLADSSMSRHGMNQFGLGMKAASAWLGNSWRIESTSIDDNITRVIEVNLTDMAKNQIKEIDSLETIDSSKSHGTIITISDLWPENAIKENNVESLMKNIASIYRYFIRNNEIQIYFGDKLLTFEDYSVLKCPSYKDPTGESIVWKKPVTQEDNKGRSISGFIGLLDDGKGQEERRGVVFTMNNRVVMGFDPQDRTVGKIFRGQIGSPKYRRVFGELEISGFSVAFGKNKLIDIDDLEALCECAAAKLKINGANLLTQAEKYKAKKKSASPVPSKPQQGTSQTTPQVEHPVIQPTPPDIPVIPQTPPTYPTSTPGCVPSDFNPVLASGTFSFNSVIYTCEVVEGSESSELFWNDLSQISNGKLVCKVNMGHLFFMKYGKPTESILALFKTISIAKYKTVTNGGDASDMMNEFNTLLLNLR